MDKRLTVILLLAIIFLINAVIVYLTPTTLMWDENVYLANAKHILGITPYFEYFRFPLLWWNLSLFIFLFGYNIYVIKLYLLLIFLISLAFFYSILSEDGETWEAVFFTMLLAFNGLVLFYATKIYPDVYGMSFTILSIYFFYHYLKHKKVSDFVLYIIFSILAFLAKYPYGLWLFSSWVLLDKREKIRAIEYSIIFLLPFFIYNLVLYKQPIFILVKELTLAYLWQVKEPITKFFENSFTYLGFLMAFIFLFPKNKFERANYIFALLSFIYFAFFVPQKDPRYLIQMLPSSILLFKLKMKEFKGFQLPIYMLLGFSMVYSTISGISDILHYSLCYGKFSAIYQSIEFLKKVKAKRVISNSFWVWYGNHLNIAAYSIYNNSIDVFIKKYKPDYIVYSKNYGIRLNLSLNRYERVFYYKDLCGIDVEIYKVR